MGAVSSAVRAVRGQAVMALGWQSGNPEQVPPSIFPVRVLRAAGRGWSHHAWRRPAASAPGAGRCGLGIGVAVGRDDGTGPQPRRLRYRTQTGPGRRSTGRVPPRNSRESRAAPLLRGAGLSRERPGRFPGDAGGAGPP